MELAIQKILRNGATLDELHESLGIKSNRHHFYHNLVCLKYDHINSPMGVQAVQECRGLILDEGSNWDVVSMSYRKFFNLGEGHAADLDLANATFYPKLDGSLMTLYWYENSWHVQTSGTADAMGEVQPGMTFNGLFWDVWERLGYELPYGGSLIDYRDYCFIFELETPINRIVVDQRDLRLTLHGIRNRVTLEEMPLSFVEQMDGCTWTILQPDYQYCVGEHPQNWDQVKAYVDSFDGTVQEGLVALQWDSSTNEFKRIKIKSKHYLALHHMVSGVRASDKNMWELLRTNETAEWLSYFPEKEEEFRQMHFVYDMLIGNVIAVYSVLRSIPEQKEFAMLAKESHLGGLLFNLRSGKIDYSRNGLRKHLSSMQLNGFVKLMESQKEFMESAHV